ncbi:tubulin binding cofactor C-domain-containing protein [Syncephalis plumigaleata]|nr:tubulin binding cofactor C-domain-containing protein [Syncephalis plumigaleata]
MTQSDNNTSKTTASASFWTEFHKEQESSLDDIRSSGRGLEAQLSQILQRINTLRAKVTDAVVYLPTYDEQQYMKGLTHLSEQLNQKRAQFAPRKKFAFRSRPVTAVASTKSTTATSNNSQSTTTNVVTTSTSVETTKTFELRDRSNEYVTLTRYLSDQSASAIATMNDGALTNITDCIVDLRLPAMMESSDKVAYRSLSALHIRQLKRCIVLLGNIEGSVMLHDCEQCILIMACRQFRMHTSKQCDIYIHCSSQPIIEHCEQIRFAPSIPAFFDEQIKGTPFADETNRWHEVNDFLWIKRHQASPHWSLIDEEAKERTEAHQMTIWKMVTSPSISSEETTSQIDTSKMIMSVIPS